MNAIDRILGGFTHDELAGGTKGEYAADGSRLQIGQIPKPLRRESANAIRRRIVRTKAAAFHLGDPPAKGEEIAFIMGGEYHGLDLIIALLHSTPATCERLTIATLSTNASNAEEIAKLVTAGKVRDVVLVASEMFRDKSPEQFKPVKDAIEAVGGRVFAARNHAKIALMQMDDGARYVMHGSLNLRRCHSFEQVVIVNDAQLFEFFEGFIDSMSR